MTLPYANISMSAVNTELGRTSTATLSMNDSAVRILGKRPTGTISMSDLRGRSLPSTVWVNNQKVNWSGIAASTTKFVAVGDKGYIANGTNTFGWTVLNSNVTPANLTSVAYSSSLNMFMAVGDNGVIITSTDGTTWVRGVSPTTSRIEFVAWANNLFVIGGAGGMMYATTNATSWTARTTGTTQTIRHCVYSSTLALHIYVADAGVIASSPNNITWTARTSGHTNRLNAVAWTGTFFIAVGNFGRWNKSTDGITWTTGQDGTLHQYGVAWTGTTVIVCGQSGSAKTSTDGTTWTARTTTETDDLKWLVYSSTPVATQAVGNNGAITQTGSQGVNWNDKLTPIGSSLTGIEYANSQFIAVGASGSIYTSADGDYFTSRTSNTSALLNAVLYGGAKWIVGGAAGTITTSSDNGVTWAVSNAGTGTINCLAYGNGIYVLGADFGAVKTSPDGTTWTTRSIGGVSNHIYGAEYESGLNMFVICGQSGAIFTSVDNGVTWTARASTTTENIFNVIFAAGVFIAVAGAGVVITSANGINWTQVTAPTTLDVRAVTYATELGLVCVVGQDGIIYTTKNITASPVVWTARTSGTTQTLNGVAWNGQQFLAVGNFGTILES